MWEEICCEVGVEEDDDVVIVGCEWIDGMRNIDVIK